MTLFQFMGEHPWLTLIIVFIVCDMLSDWAKAIGNRKGKHE
jgi:hypothetical protein